MSLMSVCPLLIPQNTNKTFYSGIITISDQEFQVQIRVPHGNLKHASLDCEWKLKHLLKGYEELVKLRLQQSTDLASFFVEFKSIVERQLSRSHSDHHAPPPPTFYDLLLEEIEHLGWERLSYIDPSFQTLHLQATDTGGRKHILQLKLDSQYPKEPPSCSADLPLPFDVKLISNKPCSLSAVFNQFQEKLSSHQDFWDLLGEIDQNTWVLEPEKPTYSATRRRIALGNNASIQIDIDPLHPRMLPECRFMGADQVINPLRENLNNRLEQWNAEKSLLTNLQTILDTEFPSPSNTRKEDFNTECGICYAYRLETEIPDKACDDTRCGQPFHQTCLYEWLRGLPSSRQSFNTVFGECPYCNKSITVKMPTTR